MRILLDECVDEELRHYFGRHQCQTCRYAGLKGLSNGRLLAAAQQAGFDVLVTVDRNLPHQHKQQGRVISILVIISFLRSEGWTKRVKHFQAASSS